MEEGPGPKKKYIDADGEIITAPRNFQVKQLSGGKTASSLVISYPDGHYKYEGDDYNAQKKLVGQDLKFHRETVEKVGEGKPFLNRAGKQSKKLFDGNFNTYSSVLAEESLPQVPKKHSQPGEKYVVKKPKGAFEHDLVFKPGGVKAKKIDTIQDFINKFPEWKADPPTEKKKRIWDDDAPRGWCVTYRGKSVPTPSVALNSRNLKSSFPSVFKR